MSITSIQMQEIIKRIKAKRESLGLSFQQLSKSTLQRYEARRIKNIPLDELDVLATTLQTTPEWILGWKRETEKGELQMATTKEEISNNVNCIIKCEPHRELACGYTRVKIMPNNYSKIILISGMTGKTIQDVTNELLEYATSKVSVQVDENNIVNLSDIGGNNQ